MQDSISKGQGNSRYLKSVANFKALYPTYDDFVEALVAGTLPVDFNGKNNAGWQQIGTELSKANLMSDQSASLFNLSSSNVPDDIFTIIGSGLPISNGGTSATTASRAFYNLVSSLSTVTSASSSYYIPMQYSTSGRKISFSNLATAIAPSVASSITPDDIGACRIQVGKYNGSGVSGSSNPSHITCSFSPVLVGIIRESDNTGKNLYGYDSAEWRMMDVVSSWPSSYTLGYGFGYYKWKPSTSDLDPVTYGKKSGNTIYWYHRNDTAPAYQLNESGFTYQWFAIG